MTENAQGLVGVGKLVLAFAKVNRGAYHEDGVRPESDTDHTVMVLMCACALGKKLYPELDQGLIAQFSIVHDLVEVYADDTDSFGITEEEKKAKDKREHEAFLRIKNDFSSVFPWIPETIETYESLKTKEARFVKTVDKLAPKIVHIINKGAYFKKRGLTEEKMWSDYQTMTKVLEERYASEFPELVALLNELISEARNATYGN